MRLQYVEEAYSVVNFIFIPVGLTLLFLLIYPWFSEVINLYRATVGLQSSRIVSKTRHAVAVEKIKQSKMEELASRTDEVVELESQINAVVTKKDQLINRFSKDENVGEPSSDKVVVDRSIEFPPEYYQAGLGILNYFGTFLRENYGEADTKVRIEQDGQIVRLIIETDDGKREIIEKALQDYELIVTGAESPENMSLTDRTILELRSELRIASVRIDDQKDLIAYQKGTINQFMSIVGRGLIRSSDITVSPVIHTQISVEVNQNISQALGNLSELLSSIPRSSEAYAPLQNLDEALRTIETEKDPAKVRSSPAMSKFRRILDKVTGNNEKFSSALDALDEGADIVSDLARNYNKIASWCGLPHVPEQLLKAKKEVS